MLLLDGSDTFTGSVAVGVGTLALGNAGALAATTNAVSVTSGATLDLGGQTIGVNTLAISGIGVGGNGALINSSASRRQFCRNDHPQRTRRPSAAAAILRSAGASTAAFEHPDHGRQ